MNESGIPIRRLFIAVIMVLVSTLPVFLAGASFLQLESEIGLTAGSLGVVTAAFFLTAAVTSTPLGRMVERIGWRLAMRINVVVSATIVLLIAIFTTSPLILGGLLVAAGTVYGFTNPAANLALAETAAPSRRGIVFGLKHAGIPSSTLVSGALVPLVVLTLGWRPAFVVSTLFAALAWFLIRSEPDRPTAPIDHPDRPSLPPLSQGQLVTMSAGAALATWAPVFLGIFLVGAAVEADLTEAQAGVLLFAGSAASITARVVAGFIADKKRSTGFFGVSLMMGIGAIGFIFIVGATGWTFVWAVIAGFAFAWGWPGLMTFSVVNANAGTAASSSAVAQAGVFIGAGLGPLVLGWVVEERSFDLAIVLVTAILVAAAITVLVVAMQRRSLALSRAAGEAA